MPSFTINFTVQSVIMLSVVMLNVVAPEWLLALATLVNSTQVGLALLSHITQGGQGKWNHYYKNFPNVNITYLRGVYTGEKTLHIVAVASNGDLKRWEDFYWNRIARWNRYIQIPCVNEPLVL
jgi:hypothetical protein